MRHEAVKDVTPEDPNQVNPHYLNHVMATSAHHVVEAAEDIVTGNGIKLLAKGARIDPDVQERLLQHKLHKPLEECVQVVDGVAPSCFGPVAEELADQHALVKALCAPSGGAMPIPDALARLKLSLPVQSLLTVFTQYQGDRLKHSVGVAMLAVALGRRLVPGDIERHRQLALAGLLHDVGELYIDPALLQRDTRLLPEQWRHIASHPVIGDRVLRDMEGAGPAVASAVLLHHERLDGFGYPRGVGGAELTLDGQILGVAEWLMALTESGMTPLIRTRVATRIITGEFSDELVNIVSAAAMESEDLLASVCSPAPLEDITPRVVRIADTMHRFSLLRPWIDEQMSQAKGEFRNVLSSGLARMARLQTGFISTGLDTQDPAALLHQLAGLADPELHIEVLTIVREIEWRFRALERDTLLRAGLLGERDDAIMHELIGRLTGTVPMEQDESTDHTASATPATSSA